MQYVGDLLRLARQRTDNIEWGQVTSSVGGNLGDPTEGLSDDLLLDFINDGQAYITGKIFQACPEDFSVTKEIPLLNMTEAYSIDDNVFLSNRILSVRFSPNGDPKKYRHLHPKTIQERDTGRWGYPEFYIRLNRQVLINPVYVGSGGLIEVCYNRNPDRLDIRRGKVGSYTGTPVTAINVDASFGAIFDDQGLSRAQYVCLCDPLGKVLDYNVPIASYNTGTHVLTLTTATTISAPVGSYITVGRYTTTHSIFDPHVERYFKIYCQKRMLSKDSSADSVEESAELRMVEDQILESYEDDTADVMEVTIVDDTLR